MKSGGKILVKLIIKKKWIFRNITTLNFKYEDFKSQYTEN